MLKLDITKLVNTEPLLFVNAINLNRRKDEVVEEQDLFQCDSALSCTVFWRRKEHHCHCGKCRKPFSRESMWKLNRLNTEATLANRNSLRDSHYTRVTNGEFRVFAITNDSLSPRTLLSDGSAQPLYSKRAGGLNGRVVVAAKGKTSGVAFDSYTRTK